MTGHLRRKCLSPLSELGYWAPMRNSRSLAVVALSVLPLIAWVTGCGGDDSSSGGTGTPDSSTTGTGGSSGTTSSGGSSGSTLDSGPAAPTAAATAITLYIGNVAKLDGSQSTGASALTYGWTLKTAPAGSTITTASLATANAAATSFTPDKLGVYELELTVSAGGENAKTTVTATVVDPPVFYFDRDELDGGSRARLLVTGATGGDGGPGKAVACFERDAGSYETILRRTAQSGTDWWEAPAGQPSKAAFIMETVFDGGQAQALFGATSNGTCAVPTKIDGTPPTDGFNRTFEQPRISPDGTRVAYARQAGAAQVVAAGLDGSNLRVLGARFADDAGNGLPEAGLEFTPSSRPFWQGTTHVAWIERVGDAAWQIVRAPDAANATREVVARCTGSATPQEGAFLPSGEIVVSQQTEGGSTVLVAYPIVAATKTCGAARVLTPVPDGGSLYATDFQVSPDGAEIAFLGSGSEPYIVKTTGTAPPRKIAKAGTAPRGPRWVGSGAFVSWGIYEGSAPDSGVDDRAIVVASADGGTPEAGVAFKNVPVVGSNTESIGNGLWSGCNVGNGVGSGVVSAGLGALALLRVVRRRRRA